jgi:hypothetical protein
MEPRIAILGSCITRDLWPIRGEGLPQLAYVSRTSFPGLLTPPVRDFAAAPTPPADLHAHEYGALVADFRKTALARLVAYRPTHLILDLIDERFDLLAVERALVSVSGELVRSGHLDRNLQGRSHRVSRLSAACDRVWSEAAGEFAAVVRATALRDATLILHSARWATHVRGADGRETPIRDVEIVTGQGVNIADYNALLARQEAALKALAPPLMVVSAPTHQVADANHRWGLSPFHYVPEYYAEIGRQLAALGVPCPQAAAAPLTAPPVTGSSVAPNAPEASSPRAPARATSRDRRPSETPGAPPPPPRRRRAGSPRAG